MKNIKLLGSAMLVSLALFSQSSLAKEYKIGASLLTSNILSILILRMP